MGHEARAVGCTRVPACRGCAACRLKGAGGPKASPGRRRDWPCAVHELRGIRHCLKEEVGSGTWCPESWRRMPRPRAGGLGGIMPAQEAHQLEGGGGRGEEGGGGKRRRGHLNLSQLLERGACLWSGHPSASSTAAVLHLTAASEIRRRAQGKRERTQAFSKGGVASEKAPTASQKARGLLSLL